MAIFVTSAPALQGPTTVTSSATQIFNTTGTPIGSPASPTEFTAGVNLGALTVTNTGTVACWVGASSVTDATGVPLQAGESFTIENGKHLAAESGTKSWNLYAITASGTTTVEAALATFPSVV
jgi:hypothetical protein